MDVQESSNEPIDMENMPPLLGEYRNHPPISGLCQEPDTRQDPFVFSFLLLNLPPASRVWGLGTSPPYPYSALLRTSPPGSRDFNCRDTVPSMHTAGTTGPNRAPGSLFKLVLLNERCLNGPLGSIEPDSFPKQSWARGEVIVLIDGEHRKRVLALAIY